MKAFLCFAFVLLSVCCIMGEERKPAVPAKPVASSDGKEDSASAPPVLAWQLAYYSFDNDTKESLRDTISGLHIVPRKQLPAADFKPGVLGNALELQGDSKGQYICRDQKLTKLAPPFTISVWFKHYEDKEKTSVIVATGSDHAPKGFELTWSWRYLVFRMGLGEGKKEFVLKSPEPILDDNVWTHVAVCCDTKGAALYIDGKPIAEGAIPPEDAFVPADGLGTAFTIGHFPSPFEAYKFVGLIDELRIFRKALSAEEVSEVMFLAQ